MKLSGRAIQGFTLPRDNNVIAFFKLKSLSIGSLSLYDLGKLSAKIQVGNSELASGAPSQGPAPCASSCRDVEEMLLGEELLWSPAPQEEREVLMGLKLDQLGDVQALDPRTACT